MVSLQTTRGDSLLGRKPQGTAPSLPGIPPLLSHTPERCLLLGPDRQLHQEVARQTQTQKQQHCLPARPPHCKLWQLCAAKHTGTPLLGGPWWAQPKAFPVDMSWGRPCSPGSRTGGSPLPFPRLRCFIHKSLSGQPMCIAMSGSCLAPVESGKATRQGSWCSWGGLWGLPGLTGATRAWSCTSFHCGPLPGSRERLAARRRARAYSWSRMV